ncbi:metal-dependent hydrolase, partial [Acinetobacter baumannii]
TAYFQKNFELNAKQNLKKILE